MTIFSTIWSDDEEFERAVQCLDWRRLGDVGLIRAIQRVGDRDVLIANGAIGFPGRWRDLVACALARSAGRRFGLVVADATWEPRSDPIESRSPQLWHLNDRLNRFLLRRVAGPRTVACFLSRSEVEGYLSTARRPGAAATFTPFFASSADERGPGPEVPSGPPYLFSGGDTLRDWGLLAEALGGLDLPVRVATRHTQRRWPSNFVVGPVSHEEFVALGKNAAAGVICLRGDVRRSAGQQTYLNLVSHRVPTVVSEAPGVRDHLSGLAGAFVTPAGDPVAIRERVAWLIDPANAAEVSLLTETGAAEVRSRFSKHRYLQRLVEVARSLEETAVSQG